METKSIDWRRTLFSTPPAVMIIAVFAPTVGIATPTVALQVFCTMMFIAPVLVLPIFLYYEPG